MIAIVPFFGATCKVIGQMLFVRQSPTDGTYSYTYGELQSNRVVNDDDTGVVELSGAFFTFKGRKHVRRYRFVNLQQTLDGSTLMSL